MVGESHEDRIDDESILVRHVGDVLHVTLNRTSRGNAIDHDTAIGLIDLLGAAPDDGRTRAVLLTGAGKHFCTGADISSTKRSSGETRPAAGHMVRSLAATHHRLIEVLWNCPLPTVAAVRGRASGMGLHVALACDLAVCADTATFAEPFSDRGFNVDSGGSWLLQRAVGVSRAKWLLYSSSVIDAATAGSWGLVHDVVPEADLDARAAELAATLAGGPTFAIGVTKSLVHRAGASSLAEALEREAHGVELTIRSDDFKEGMNAFKEKRPPRFTGR